jgi:hypothetical protein
MENPQLGPWGVLRKDFGPPSWGSCGALLVGRRRGSFVQLRAPRLCQLSAGLITLGLHVSSRQRAHIATCRGLASHALQRIILHIMR